MHLVLGVLGGPPANVAMILLFADLVPTSVPWMVTGDYLILPDDGSHSLALGEHIRTDLEDVLYVAPEEYVEPNAQLVMRARDLCEATGQPVATPAQAREILGSTPEK